MFIRIETHRLILRDHLPEDLTPLHSLLSDPAAMWYLPDMYREGPGETLAYLEGTLRDIHASPRLRCNLAVLDQSGALLGEVGLHHIDGDLNAGHWGLGYFIHPDRWNLGYATEAVRAALRWRFERGAFRISASCLSENPGSRRVLEKCGFTQEGLLKAHTRHDGAWKDCAVYRLLREEYTDPME